MIIEVGPQATMSVIRQDVLRDWMEDMTGQYSFDFGFHLYNTNEIPACS